MILHHFPPLAWGNQGTDRPRIKRMDVVGLIVEARKMPRGCNGQTWRRSWARARNG
jgi:hypothetical protein